MKRIVKLSLILIVAIGFGSCAVANVSCPEWTEVEANQEKLYEQCHAEFSE